MDIELKELFNAYKNLPVGVLFFKDGRLFFVNDHLRSVLLLAHLSTDDIINIIGNMLSLESPSHIQLKNFLLSNDFFIHRDRIIQVKRQITHEIDIFVLIRLSDKVIDVLDATHSLRKLHEEKIFVAPLLPSDNYEILTTTLGEWENTYFPSTVLYKGIPIKGDSIILEVKHKKIKVKVEKKQLIAAQIGHPWFMGSNRETILIGDVYRYDLAQNIIWLENLRMLNHEFNMDRVIRYQTEDNDQFIVSINGKPISLKLYDISEEGLSLQSDDASVLAELSTLPEKSIDAEIVLDRKKIALKATYLHTSALETSSMTLIAFTIKYDLHNGDLLKNWMNATQLHFIQEVRNFIQTIPSR